MAHENHGARWRRHVEKTTPRNPTARALEAMKDLIDKARWIADKIDAGEFHNYEPTDLTDFILRIQAAEDAYAEVME